MALTFLTAALLAGFPAAPQDEPPLLDEAADEFLPQGRPPRRGVPQVSAWDYFAMGPYKGPRNNAWHGLFNTPPLEEALVLPKGLHHVRAMFDITSSEWNSQKEGGRSQWNAVYVSEIFEYNYGLTEQFLLGARLSLGELGEGNDEPIRVFENNQQIIPDGKRGFGFESIVGRAKFAGTMGFADAGVLVEVKIPIASDEDLLTAQTIDFGVSALLSKRWQRFSLHVNGGVVFPMSDPEIFKVKDEADYYIHGGVCAAFRPHSSVAITAQVEFNTSAFSEVTVVDAQVMAFTVGARYKFQDNAFVSTVVGKGLNEDSGDLMVSAALDYLF